VALRLEHVHVAERLLSTAGVRLAALLNAVFDQTKERPFGRASGATLQAIAGREADARDIAVTTHQRRSSAIALREASRATDQFPQTDNPSPIEAARSLSSRVPFRSWNHGDRNLQKRTCPTHPDHLGCHARRL